MNNQPQSLENIIDSNNNTIAIIVRNHFTENGIHFFTGPDFSQQLGYMSHPKGKRIKPHCHKKVERKIQWTQEVLFIRKGTLRVTLYDDTRKLIATRDLVSGDVILLASGGHGFEVIDDCIFLEVKQGPYSGVGDDKEHFEDCRS